MSVDDLRELYQEVILDHNKNPRNFGELSDANYTADGNNPLCGDRLTVYLKLDDNELVNEVSFTGKGCAISIASASMMTTVVKGKTVKQVNDLFDKFHKLCTGESDEAELDEFEDEIAKLRVMSGVRQFPMRVKCATLSWHAVEAAINKKDTATTE